MNTTYRLAMAGLGLVAVLAYGLLAWVTLGYGTPGKTLNGGLVAQAGQYTIGLELWGTPGVFLCQGEVCLQPEP